MGWERLLCSLHLVKAPFISDSVERRISSITGTAHCWEKPARAGGYCPWGAGGSVLTRQPARKPVDQLGSPLHLVSYSASVGLGTISLLVAYLPSFLLPVKDRLVTLLMKLGKDFHGCL